MSAPIAARIPAAKNVELVPIKSAINPPTDVALKTESEFMLITLAIVFVELSSRKKEAYITLIATQPAAAIPVIVLAANRDQGSGENPT